MMRDIHTIIRSIRFAIKGLRHAWQLDKSFRLEVVYGLPMYLIVGFLLRPLSEVELLLLCLSYTLILIVELVNTAFEKMLDRVHPEDHELIGKSKDISSASVLLAFLFAIIVVCSLLYVRFFPLGIFDSATLFA